MYTSIVNGIHANNHLQEVCVPIGTFARLDAERIIKKAARVQSYYDDHGAAPAGFASQGVVVSEARSDAGIDLTGFAAQVSWSQAVARPPPPADAPSLDREIHPAPPSGAPSSDHTNPPPPPGTKELEDGKAPWDNQTQDFK